MGEGIQYMAWAYRLFELNSELVDGLPFHLMFQYCCTYIGISKLNNNMYLR